MSLLDLRSTIKAHTAELKQLKKQRAAATKGSAVSNKENSKAAPLTVDELDSKIARKKVMLKKMKVHQDHLQLNGGKTAASAAPADAASATSAASAASAASASTTSTINNASTAPSTSNVTTAVAAAGPGELLLYVYGDAVLTKCGAP
jgi:septal ring factor EnvC (AmiA/AmiB activator)